MKKISKPIIVFLSSSPHKSCGIAKFTRDLKNSTQKLFESTVDFKRIGMVNDSEKNSQTSGFFLILKKNQKKDYRECARIINKNKKIKLVSIQHEFGIFGGKLGSFLLAFMENLDKPILLTFHTVIPEPGKEMLHLVKKMGKLSKVIIVMTDRSRRILMSKYRLNDKKIKIVPHGIPSFHYEENNKKIKNELGFKNKYLLFTHGFLSRNKGIEYVIDALPGVVKKFPQTVYLLAGRTHPNVKRLEGESYRNFLLKKTKELGIEKNVRFINKFITTHDLIEYLKACDIYLSTSLDPRQAVSGTLAYALGSGRAVVSTSFAHSKEELKKCKGILVNPRDSKSYEKALLKLLRDEKKRKIMGMSCYFKTRNMTWQNVALSYGRIFSNYVPNVGKSLILPPVVLSHLFKMTSGFGLFQFAKLAKPIEKSGYTVDDNARALAVTCMYYKRHKDKSALNFLKIYLNFLKYAQDVSTGYFRNYVNSDYSFNEKRNNKESREDPTSRALYSLAKTISAYELPETLRSRAMKILKRSLDRKPEFSHTRSIAFYLKALYFYSKVAGKKRFKDEIIKYARVLCGRFEKHSSKSWHWFEDFLAYSNGIIPESMLLSYRITRKKEFLEIANIAADFLIKHSFRGEICTPIGQRYWYRKGRKRSYFDQQPEEVASLVEMLKTFYLVTGEVKYKTLMINAYNWFLGNNTLNQIVCDFKTGGCYDGVGEKEVNLNQGAESTLSYLTARLIVSRK